jgi:hypothetical protein
MAMIALEQVFLKETDRKRLNGGSSRVVGIGRNHRSWVLLRNLVQVSSSGGPLSILIGGYGMKTIPCLEKKMKGIGRISAFQEKEV